jgi:site-specific DNA recombinase
MRSSRRTETAIFPKKTIRCTLVQDLKTERTGFVSLDFFKVLSGQHFRHKSRRSIDIGRSQCVASCPIETRRFAPKQGQNRDKIRHLYVIYCALTIVPFLAIIDGGSQGKRRGKRDKGLPSTNDLKELAELYLELQSTLWDPQSLQHQDPAVMAEDFRSSFLDADWRPSVDSGRLGSGAKLGAVYVRYSCDHSNPRSLAQQLRNCLERARKDEVFVPWRFVFADAAVSGTTADRRGYMMCKRCITELPDENMHVYLDELGRAARDMIESLRLGRIVQAYDARLIGVTDNFDSSSAQSQMMLTIYGLVNEHFVEQLRAKVDRGMKDAFKQGGVVSAAGTGYKLVPKLDAHGNQLIRENGKAVREYVVDDEVAAHVRELFRLFVVDGWSPDRIARQFNQLAVDGRTTWDRKRIVALLTRQTYIGVELTGMTKGKRDPETGKRFWVTRPENEWRRRESPHLRIVSDQLFFDAQERLRQISEAFAKSKSGESTRTNVYPKMLFRPNCGSCGLAMWLGNSGPHRSLCCRNGITGKNGCTMRGYKSVKVIEKSVLTALLGEIVSDEFVSELVQQANAFLVMEAAKPKADLGPIRTEQRKIRKRLETWKEKIVTTDDLPQTVLKAIRELEARLAQLSALEKEATPITSMQIVPITEDDVKGMLGNIVELLYQDVGVAAQVLNKLVSRLTLSTTQVEGRKQPVWTAEFDVTGVRLFAELTCEKKLPSRGSWECLYGRNWKFSKTVRTVVKNESRLRVVHIKCIQLARDGVPLQTIRRALEITPKQAQDFLSREPEPTTIEDAEGKELKVAMPNYLASPAQMPLYRRIAPEVARLRDERQLPLEQVLLELQSNFGIRTTMNTILRAYDFAHPERIADAIDQKKLPRRIAHLRRTMEIKAKILALLTANPKIKVKELAAAAGCAVNTALKYRKIFRAA